MTIVKIESDGLGAHSTKGISGNLIPRGSLVCGSLESQFADSEFVGILKSASRRAGSEKVLVGRKILAHRFIGG